jgi:hypothetical protein
VARLDGATEAAVMKLRIYSILLTNAIVVVLFESADHLPEFFKNLLVPGFFAALMINGSLHDHIMPGYSALGIFFNCVFYSALVFLGITLFQKLRNSD